MLGRLRMKVTEAQSHYNTVGNEVFKHPRVLPINGLRRNRYSSKRFERTLQRILQQYHEGPSEQGVQNGSVHGSILHRNDTDGADHHEETTAIRLENPNRGLSRT